MQDTNACSGAECGKSGCGFRLNLSIRQVFWGGFAAGALALAALGFFALLWHGAGFSKYFGGSLDREGGIPTAAQPSAAQPSANEPQVGQVPPLTKDDHVRGDKGAVVMVEYSDFQCPYCSRFHATMLQVMDAYKGQVRWVFRHFPLSSIHPDAQKAAEAAECAGEQGKFWEMADVMFANQSAGLGAALLPGYAQKAGVSDLGKFKSCLSSGKMASRIQADQQGGEAAGITGTPGTIVVAKDGSTQLVPGALPFESVKQMIDAALK